MIKNLALLLLVSVSLSFAVDIVACGGNTLSEITAAAGGWISILIALTVFTLAVVYMLASSFNKPEYVVIVKDEFFHLGMSIGILVFFAAIMTVSCGIVGGAFDYAYEKMQASSPTVQDDCYANYHDSTVQKIGVCYLKAMETDSKRLLNAYTKGNIDLQIDASGYVSYYGLIGGVTFAPKGYKRSQAMFLDNLGNLFILPAYVSIASQDMFMKFMLGGDNATSGPAILGAILPAAFVLRFFPPSRQAGNMLIAFAVGLYLVIPFFVALNGIMYKYAFNYDDCKNNYAGIVTDPIARLGDCDSPSNLLAVARLYPQAFLLPNLTLVVFITFITAANKALKVLG